MQMTLNRGPTEGPQRNKKVQVYKRKGHSITNNIGLCEWHAKREKYSDGGKNTKVTDKQIHITSTATHQHK